MRKVSFQHKPVSQKQLKELHLKNCISCSNILFSQVHISMKNGKLLNECFRKISQFFSHSITTSGTSGFY